MQKDCFNPSTPTTTGSCPTPFPTREGSGKGLRVYGRSELAQLYYGRPISDSRARRWLMEELAQQPGLMEKLVSLGFKKKGKTFSRAQVAAIFAAIGEP